MVTLFPIAHCLRSCLRSCLVVALLLLLSSVLASAQTTTFSYQGRLQDTGTPANGSYDLQFRLFDAAVSGNQVGTTLVRQDVLVTGGTFSVSLDFGAAAFPGADRFLEIGVRPGPSTDAFTALSPLQPITATPYAVQSLNATNATTATNSTQLGGVAASQYALKTDAPAAGSANYIQNGTAPQAASSFNISGNGTAGSLSANTVDVATYILIGGGAVLSAVGNNTFVGIETSNGSTASDSNSFFGSFAGSHNRSSHSNSFFGSHAGEGNETGSNNSFFGVGAGSDNASGSRNTFVGVLAGSSNGNDDSNTFIGFNAHASFGVSKSTAIGASAVVSQSNSLVLGDGVNVGIGTSAPAAKLHVVGGSICGGPYCQELNGRITAGGSGGEITFLDRNATSFVDSPTTGGERWVLYDIGGRARLWSGADKLSIDPSGTLRVLGTVQSSTTPDIAETIAADSSVTAADVVCADPLHRERAIRCSKNDRAILGVISDGTGGFLINSNAKSTDAPLTGKPLVLAGRVPVKVSLENGAIQIGDFLSPSSTPGVAMRAGNIGPTIGIALEAFNPETKREHADLQTGTVLCFIKVGQADSSAALAQLNEGNERFQQENAALKIRLEQLEQKQRN